MTTLLVVKCMKQFFKKPIRTYVTHSLENGSDTLAERGTTTCRKTFMVTLTLRRQGQTLLVTFGAMVLGRLFLKVLNRKAMLFLSQGMSFRAIRHKKKK